MEPNPKDLLSGKFSFLKYYYDTIVKLGCKVEIIELGNNRKALQFADGSLIAYDSNIEFNLVIGKQALDAAVRARLILPVDVPTSMRIPNEQLSVIERVASDSTSKINIMMLSGQRKTGPPLGTMPGLRSFDTHTIGSTINLDKPNTDQKVLFRQVATCLYDAAVQIGLEESQKNELVPVVLRDESFFANLPSDDARYSLVPDFIFSKAMANEVKIVPSINWVMSKTESTRHALPPANSINLYGGAYISSPVSVTPVK